MASSDPPNNAVTDSEQKSESADSVTKETSTEKEKEERVETGDNGKGEKAESPVSSSDPAKVDTQAVDGAEAEGSTPPPVDSSSDAEKDDTDMSKKIEGDKGSQPGKDPEKKIEQPEKEAGGKEQQVKDTVGKKEDDPHGKKETKSSPTSSHKSPSAKQEASKPWSFFRSSTSPVETREYFENLSLGDKRKLYYCGSKYKQLKDIQTWPVFQAANGCKSSRSLKSPKQADPSINCKVSLWRGDITSLEIDAIVNAANTSLLGGGGVDGAIHDAAGRSLRRECMELNGCSTGDAKITGGHRLPAKFILHTVGPIGEYRDQLKSCYERCLELVERHKIKSVAFCCLSTGIYGYPNTSAAVQALGSVRSWLESSQYARNEMERVIFCVFLKVDYEIYSELMCLFFPTPSPDPTPSLPDKEGSTATGCEEREGKEKTPPVNPESPASDSPPQPPVGVPHLKESMTAPPALIRQELGASGGAEGGPSKEGAEDSPGAREGGEGTDGGENKTQESEVSSSNPEVEGGEPNAKQPKLEGEVPPSDPSAPVSTPTEKERSEASPTTTGVKEDS